MSAEAITIPEPPPFTDTHTKQPGTDLPDTVFDYLQHPQNPRPIVTRLLIPEGAALFQQKVDIHFRYLPIRPKIF